MNAIGVATIAALAPCLLFVLNLVATRHAGRDRSEKHDETTNTLTQIHVLVNSRLEDALRRIDQLEHALAIEPGADPPAARVANVLSGQ